MDYEVIFWVVAAIASISFWIAATAYRPIKRDPDEFNKDKWED